MDLNDYQVAALRTMKKHPNREVQILYFSGALCGEAGEAFEIVKKAIRDEKSVNIFSLEKELGDTLWYIAAICEVHGLKLDQVAQINLRKLAARYPKGHFDVKDSNRER